MISQDRSALISSARSEANVIGSRGTADGCAAAVLAAALPRSGVKSRGRLQYVAVAMRAPRKAGYGFFHITQLAIAEMEKRGSGHVVQITTTLVDHANSRVPSVLASLTKGGLNAATKSLAIEYAKRGIRINAVAPGTIRTRMHPTETHEALAMLHPVGRMGEISDIVDAVLYLETASFVTGEIFHGGQNAGH